MDIWQWLLTICGSLLVLVILLGILAYRWLRMLHQEKQQVREISAHTLAMQQRGLPLFSEQMGDDALLKNWAERLGSQEGMVLFWYPTDDEPGFLHPELLVQEQDSEIAIPPGFAADIYRAQQLEELRQRDPRAVEPLIQVYKRMLDRLQPNENPTLYAGLQHNLGRAYGDLLTGNHAANLEKAIECYQQSLRFWTPETAPLDYAMTQHNLGTTYGNLPTGNRAANLEQAINCYRQALRFRTPETGPLEYATAQHNLGNAYRELTTGNRAANLEQAIECYQQALRFWTPMAAPLEFAATQNNLGVAYWELPTGDRAANLEQAIRCYQEALRFWTPETAPLDYAMTQNNLGLVYSEMPTGDRATNLKQAIRYFQEALRFRTPVTAPLDYALTQNDLGNAYSELPTGDRAANLEQAIRYFQEALRFLTPEAAPLDYAMTQNNLGEAYRELPTGDRASNLTMAIECYQQALRFWTPEMAPLDYALTQNNLGNAYRELPTGDRTANLEQAIECYRQALHFRTPEAAPLDYATTQNNLGIAYSEMPTGDRATNLEQAIRYFQEALRFRTPEAAPLKYATTQNNLGAAYSNLPTGDRVTNLERAIQCYQEALRFWTPEADPLKYAGTQNNLGNAYSDLPTGDRAANLVQAINCYQQALRFYTPEAEPFKCRGITRTLAHLHFSQGAWDAALGAYRVAMDVGEQIYRVGLSTTSKAAEASESAALYPHAAFAAVRCGETAEAFLILERGKTRLLSEALRLRVPRPAKVPDEIWSLFEQAGTAVRAEKALMVAEARDPVQAYEAHVQAAQAANAALRAAIEQVRTYAPHFLEEIDLPTFGAQFLDEQTALIAFCITEQGSMGFVVSQHGQEKVQVVEVLTFTQTDLRHLLIEGDTNGRSIGGWLGAYASYLTYHTIPAFKTWQETITRVLMKLGERLLSPILSTLPVDIKRIIFLPSAELFQFPLHAVPISGSDGELLCDRYEVSYAPSIKVLADARARVRQGVVPQLYAVINPEEDPRLLFTVTEGTSIARLFVQHTLDLGRTGTKERVLARARGQTYMHFSCHGSYDWNNPPASGLNLADERLTLADLQRGEVDLSTTRLVTLSACETGITDVMRGSAEEYVGIPAGFLLAGAPCVVSSLWSVSDLSTALLMEQFYRSHLNSGMEFAAALREAQAWVRGLGVGEVVQYAEQCYRQSQRREKKELFRYVLYYRHQAQHDPTSHPFAHPYYWSAFTMNGW